MTSRASTLSTADQRRPVVVQAATEEFSRGGYLGTTVADVARTAGISPAYVFKLFPTKEALFVAALDHCFTLVERALEQGADTAADASPEGLLDAMGGAYAGLIADRTLLMLQVHAQSAAEVPEIGDALRRGLARVTTFAHRRSGATPAQVQRFIAFGQLCHLIVTARVDGIDAEWAHLLSDGIRHPEPLTS
ncbi:TetR/AcrR family transcriptional regulator [Cellulomonas soli]|uniref:TetR/AcrR family transcriptional regulator n=1 Tax=Cellulomonas soli TaxID=931535 RepID=UPI003F83D68B